MNKSFCTYLITYSGNKLPPFYIGSTSIEKIKNGYMGTICSKQYKRTWKKELFENRHLFKIKIISLHDTRESALNKEEILQKKLNVVVSPLYVNMAIANKHFVNYVSPMKGLKHTEETRKKLSEIAKNRKYSEETRKKFSTKKSSYNKKCHWYNDGNKNTFTHIDPGQGWKLGRMDQKPSTKGYKWYNDGEKNKMFSQIPIDTKWKIGLIRNKA